MNKLKKQGLLEHTGVAGAHRGCWNTQWLPEHTGVAGAHRGCWSTQGLLEHTGIAGAVSVVQKYWRIYIYALSNHANTFSSLMCIFLSTYPFTGFSSFRVSTRVPTTSSCSNFSGQYMAMLSCNTDKPNFTTITPTWLPSPQTRPA